MSDTFEETPASPPAPVIMLVVCGSLVLIALIFGAWMRWMRTAPPSTSPLFKPMSLSSDADDATRVVPLDAAARQQVGRVGATHPIPMYSPVPGATIPSGPGVVGVGGHLVVPGAR